MLNFIDLLLALLFVSYFLDEIPKTRDNSFISHEYSTSVKTQSDVFICKYVEQIKNWRKINIDFWMKQILNEQIICINFDWTFYRKKTIYIRNLKVKQIIIIII